MCKQGCRTPKFGWQRVQCLDSEQLQTPRVGHMGKGRWRKRAERLKMPLFWRRRELFRASSRGGSRGAKECGWWMVGLRLGGEGLPSGGSVWRMMQPVHKMSLDKNDERLTLAITVAVQAKRIKQQSSKLNYCSPCPTLPKASYRWHYWASFKSWILPWQT